MTQLNNLTIKNKGFSLVEMIVAVAIFIIVIGTMSGLFVSSIRAQRRILADQEILNQVSFALEYMSRALRMAKKDLTGECLLTAGTNYLISEDGFGNTIAIRFLDYHGFCHQFFLHEENGIKVIVEKKSTDATDEAWGPFINLTSDSLQVNSFNLDLSGGDQTDNLQPRVTIFLEVESLMSESAPKIQIQTSISQRNIDVEI